MKILQVINAFHPPFSGGGAAFVAHYISKALAKQGHEVTVFTTNVLSRDRLFCSEQNPNYCEGVKVYYFNNIVYKPSVHVYFSNELVRAIKKSISDYDIVHVHEYRSYISLVVNYYANKHKLPLILQTHGQLPRTGSWKRLKWIYDILFGYRLLRTASRVIALSKVEAEQYRSMGVPEEKIAIIPNGVDLSEYDNLLSKGEFKKRFNIPEDKKIILYLGRIHRIKGIDFLVKAYAYLKRKMNCNDAILVIAGPDDGYLNEVKSLTYDLSVSDSILFTGPLYGKDKLEAYVDADVYVLPSRYETFPIVVLEAYACGKPVIASGVGGLKDLVVNGETGLLFETGNHIQLAEKILYLLNNSDDALRMGLNGRRFVEENYSIDIVIDKLERIYKEIVEG